MIHVEEAVALAAHRKLDSIPVPELTDEEQFALHNLDYVIESQLRNAFNGEPVAVVVSAEDAFSANTVAALRASYEQGQWSVAVIPHRDGDSVSHFQLVFIPKVVAEQRKTAEGVLPTIIQMPSAAGTAKARLLVRMPTRGRHAQAIKVLGQYASMAGMPIKLEVVVDYDDESINSEVLYRYHALGATVTFGDHNTKIQACNGGRIYDWDILVLGSDDMVPVKEGWAARIVELYEEHYPFFDGCLHFDDGFAHERVCTLSVLGRRYFDRFGFVYHPAYASLFVDNEHTEVARSLGRLTYVPEVIIEHRHPAAGKGQLDELYTRNDALWKADEETYLRRKAKDFDQDPILLSILICTHPDRFPMLARLLEDLDDQIRHWLQEVEIVIDHKSAPSLGAKRQRLLERARGKYVCFIDDDDVVSHDFVSRICAALQSKKDVDCASLVGVMTTDGNKPELFEHSLKYEIWDYIDGVHVRYPNHLNAVRRELALEAGFGDETYTEDRGYSDRLRSLVKTEASTGAEPLYHYFYRTKRAATHVGDVK